MKTSIYIYIYIISHSVILRRRNISNKSCRGNQNIRGLEL